MSKPTRTDQPKPKVHALAADRPRQADGVPRSNAERFESLLRRHALAQRNPNNPPAGAAEATKGRALLDEPMLDELPQLLQPQATDPPRAPQPEQEPEDVLALCDEQTTQAQISLPDAGTTEIAHAQDIKRIQDLAAQAVTDYLAHTVSRFCNDPAVGRGDPWQVRIAVDSRILPGTVLNLGLSPHWLILRFECSEQSSKDLLSGRLHTLHDALSQAVVPRRDISIDLD
jgi:hypothetical protein